MTRRFRMLSLLAAVAALFGCSAPQEPEFLRLENVVFRGARLDGNVELTADAVFHNPNAIGLEISGLELDLSIDGREGVEIRQDLQTSMPANADFVLPIEIAIPARQVFEDVKGILRNLLAEKTVEVVFDGKIRVKVAGVEVGVPFRHRDQYKIKS